MAVRTDPVAGASVEPAAGRRAWRQAASALVAPSTLPLLIVLLAAGLRLYHLGSKSLWLDEAVTATATTYRTFHDLIAWTQWDDQMPLYNLITWLLGPFGHGEAFVRLPSAVAGTLTIPVMYFLGKATFGRRAGLVAALLTAVMPFAIWYSQEARPYALLMLATSLQMYFAYQAVSLNRVFDWAGLAAATLLNLYTHYIAIAATLGVCAFIGFALVYAGIRVMRGHQRRFRQWLQTCAAGFLTAVVIVVGYLPWARTLRNFLHRPTQGLARYVGDHHTATFHDVQAFLTSFNLTGLVLALLGIGLVACLAWAVAGRVQAAALPVICLVVPLGALWLKLHGSIFLLFPRYLGFLFPAAILLAAIGVESVAVVTGGLRWFARPAFGRRLAGAVSLVLAALMLVQLAPAVASGYRTPKDDYRGAADLIISSSPPDSVVLAMGRYSNFVTISLGYYLAQRHSTIKVVESKEIDDRVAARLEQGRGRVWAAVFTSYTPNDLEGVSTAGLQVSRFVGISLLRQPSSDRPPRAQAESLIRWGTRFEPELAASLDLLHVLAGDLASVTNVTATAGRWALGPGATVAVEDGSVHLRPAGATANATFTMRSVTPGHRFSLLFGYRNGQLLGEQRVFVSAHDRAGQWLAVFPNGAGYLCTSAAEWMKGAFAFALPADADSLIVWLRASGNGLAEFTNVQLEQTS